MTILSWGFAIAFTVASVKVALGELLKPKIIKFLEKKFSYLPLARWIFGKMAEAEKRKEKVMQKIEKRSQRYGWFLAILYDCIDDFIEILFRL